MFRVLDFESRSEFPHELFAAVVAAAGHCVFPKLKAEQRFNLQNRAYGLNERDHRLNVENGSTQSATFLRRAPPDER